MASTAKSSPSLSIITVHRINIRLVEGHDGQLHRIMSVERYGIFFVQQEYTLVLAMNTAAELWEQIKDVLRNARNRLLLQTSELNTLSCE